jgi:exonuclease 3'-5' domain-containing protein 1
LSVLDLSSHQLPTNTGVDLTPNMSSLSLQLPEYPMASYSVCTTPESLQVAAGVLLQHSHIILDCEGHSLGGAGGKLSLLNLGVSHEEDGGDEHLSIFVIDVLAFQGDKSKHLIPIFDILESVDVFKIVFDGRMDSSELLHGHGIKLNNVLDLQLADISSREKRGEGIDRQLRRLAGFLPKYELARNPTMYSSVQKLNGMASAMREYGIQGANKRGERC